jgi:hypothetical protein
MKRTIAISNSGGNTTEYEVSLRSAQGILLLHRQGEIRIKYCKDTRDRMASADPRLDEDSGKPQRFR